MGIIEELVEVWPNEVCDTLEFYNVNSDITSHVDDNLD